MIQGSRFLGNTPAADVLTFGFMNSRDSKGTRTGLQHKYESHDRRRGRCLCVSIRECLQKAHTMIILKGGLQWHYVNVYEEEKREGKKFFFF